MAELTRQRGSPGEPECPSSLHPCLWIPQHACLRSSSVLSSFLPFSTSPFLALCALLPQLLFPSKSSSTPPPYPPSSLPPSFSSSVSPPIQENSIGGRLEGWGCRRHRRGLRGQESVDNVCVCACVYAPTDTNTQHEKKKGLGSVLRGSLSSGKTDSPRGPCCQLFSKLLPYSRSVPWTHTADSLPVI